MLQHVRARERPQPADHTEGKTIVDHVGLSKLIAARVYGKVDEVAKVRAQANSIVESEMEKDLPITRFVLVQIAPKG
jgi:S-adenosylmethionine synthetase